MKKVFLMFLALTTFAFTYEGSITAKERRALEKEFKLYNVRYNGKAFTLRNRLAKREIVIDKRLRDLPTTSDVAFSSDKDDTAYDWSMTAERDGIQYFAIRNTSRRKAITKIDGRYVVIFYMAAGKNDEMVKDTMNDVRDALVNN